MNHANISTEFRNYAIASNAMANLTLLKMTHPGYFLDSFTWIGNPETLFCLHIRLANHRNSEREINRIVDLHFRNRFDHRVERNLRAYLYMQTAHQGLSNSERFKKMTQIRRDMERDFGSALENYQETLDLITYHARRAASPVIRGF